MNRYLYSYLTKLHVKYTYQFHLKKMVTTESGGRQNMYAKEPQVEVIETGNVYQQGELTNGRLVMIGLVAAFGAYITTGQIIPGVF